MPDSLRAHLRRALSSISDFGHVTATIRLIWQATRGLSIAWITILAVLGLLPLATVGLTKSVVDSILAGVKGGVNSPALRHAAVLGLLIGVAALLTELLQGVLDWVRARQAESIRDYISALVHRKSLEVDLEFYETPEYHDHLFRARDDAQTRPIQLLESLGSLLQNGITLISFAVVAAMYGPLIMVSIVLSMIPAALIVIRFNWLNHRLWERTTVTRRWADYYDQKFTSAIAAPEMRLFGLGPFFQGKFQRIRDQLREERLRIIKKQMLARVVAVAVTVAIAGLAIGVMGWRSFHGSATLGDLALSYQLFMGGQGLMRVFTANLGQVYTNSLFFGSFFRFLELTPKIVDPKNPVAAPTKLVSGVRFQNVTFRYPGSERVALRRLNLAIPAGKIVAVVGKNGAGKSTLVKLLSRFYDPEEGSITFDGIDLRDMSVRDLQKQLSILFQLPVSYDASVEENIRFGEIGRTFSLQEVEAAAKNAGAEEFIHRLPEGYKSLLGKAFENGNELSAGQWQRIAMARCFLRSSALVLLDEPTSFLDSWAEIDWFARLRALCLGRTAVVITHRFTIAMRADLIHLVDDGELIESGSHAELLAADGLYAQSWRDQMRHGQEELSAPAEASLVG